MTVPLATLMRQRLSMNTYQLLPHLGNPLLNAGILARDIDDTLLTDSDESNENRHFFAHLKTEYGLTTRSLGVA